MVNTIISIPGYVHLYRSLLRFYDMPENEVREMLYLLNTANLDCYEYYPLLYLMDRKKSPVYMLMPVISLLFLLPCYIFFRIGLKHYKSTGS